MLNKSYEIFRKVSGLKWGILLLAIILLIILPLFWGKPDSKPETSNMKPVKTIVLTTQTEALALEYLGTINTEELAKYSFKLPGRLGQILVAEGQAVAKGQRLVQLDTQDLILAAEAARNTREQAKSAYDFSQENYSKMTKLLEAGAVSQQDADQAKVQLDNLRAAYHNAQIDYQSKENSLADSTIKANFNGYVAEILYEEGEMVPAGYPVIVLRGEKLEVTLGVAQKDWDKVRTGMGARVYALDKELSGAVTSVGQLPDSQTRTYQVTVEIQDTSLPVGITARVLLEIGQEKGMFAPISAISHEGEDYVFVLGPEQTVRKKAVRLGRIKGTDVLVEGLAEGERIVSEGIKRLRDGDQVVIQE